MLVTLTKAANSSQVQSQLQGLGLWTRKLESQAGHPPALIVAPCSAEVAIEHIIELDGVADVCRSPSAHPLLDAARAQAVQVASTSIGGSAPAVLMAGPCSVESPEQIFEAAKSAAAAGATMLRGGAFKPRTSPYSFSGHGRPALGWMREAADATGLAVVTEVMSEHDVDTVAAVADMLQVGSRNMQSFALLRAVGAAAKPVLLKRGMAATVQEWLLSAEHLLAAGARGVVLCERGIVGFDSSTRNLLDLGAVALVRTVHQLPVVVDPSHAAGRRDLVLALSRAALAVGASGLLVEAHPSPSAARSDGPQALEQTQLQQLGEMIAGAQP